ncbi:hypothetical protein GJA_5139 [Janthinobacterium agaricidamnosum NBRC 102515 = DSM 9628]|uniref:Transposase n=1 Tax=Janthinobacterium agaricidamnosum NBRC 102515 = DSM 9628 TaxID=1349767 RepID=W0VEH5_9BURK|nr:hypothetical protein GJA_5139 [Janthinobacterium agaricidamnosum NBRC 102515 = DSM 9628]
MRRYGASGTLIDTLIRPHGRNRRPCMKRKNFPIEQIIAVLKQAELGTAVGDIVRQLDI